MQSSCFSAIRCQLLRIGRQRRNPPVWRIDNNRGPQGRDNLCSSIPPEVVVARRQVCRWINVATISVVTLAHLLLIGHRFIASKKLFAREFLRTLERRDRRIGPVAL